MLRTTIARTLLSVLCLITPNMAFAQGNASFGYFEALVGETGSVLSIFLVLGLSFALLFFFWGMALFVFKADDESEREKGKQKMFWGVIALTVAVSVWGFVNILEVMFDVGGADDLGAPGLDLPNF